MSKTASLHSRFDDVWSWKRVKVQYDEGVSFKALSTSVPLPCLPGTVENVLTFS